MKKRTAGLVGSGLAGAVGACPGKAAPGPKATYGGRRPESWRPRDMSASTSLLTASRQVVVREDWLAKTREEILEPELPIIDPHHHLWDHPGERYLLEDLLR